MTSLEPDIAAALHDGLVIPAHPLALTIERQLDEQRQRALTRYYLASGAGGVAVGVHTTQFEIREVGLLEPVLRLAVEEVVAFRVSAPERPVITVAGVCGPLEQALREAEMARELGYDLALLSPGGLAQASEAELVRRAEAVTEILPVFGFYLQPAVGGRVLSYAFWRAFADLPGVAAIKLAPFDRYLTLEAVRAVCASPRREEIALYTGNDDNIVADLLTEFEFEMDGRTVRKRIVGGLLGQWAVWTRAAVRLLERIKRAQHERDGKELARLLTLGAQLTDANRAIFDAGNGFAGCIPGIHEVLRRQGLLAGEWCLDPHEVLSPGQREEIARVHGAYPELVDDAFVRERLGVWLGAEGKN